MPWTDSDTAAAAQLAAAGVDALAAANANEEGREWAERQYDKQRADALADWQMQNDYNSPAAQMKRYTEGGLNPNLIYGQNQNGPVVRSTDTQSWKPEAPQIGRSIAGAANSLLQSTDLEMRQAQTDNIKANNKNILLDSMLKAGQLNQLGIQTEKSAFDLQQLKNLSMYQLESAQLNVEKQRADIQFTLDENQRKALANAQSLEIGLQTISNMQSTNSETKARIENLRKDGELKQLDIELKKRGLQPSDPLWMRAGVQLLKGVKVKEILKNLPPAPSSTIEKGKFPIGYSLQTP